jgi:hypothetical protein
MAISFTLSKLVYRSGSKFASIEPSHIAPELAPPQVTIAGATGAVIMSDNGAGGTFNVISGSVFEYIPANRSQTVTIRATDTLGFVEHTLSVVGTFPIQPQAGTEMDTPVGSKVVQAKDNTPYFRRMPHSGSWPLSFLNRSIMDVSVVKEFEFFHDIDLEFYFIDPELEMTQLVRFDSSVKVKTNGGNNFELNCIIKQYKMPTISIPETYDDFSLNIGSNMTQYKAKLQQGFHDNDPVGLLVDTIGSHDATAAGTARPIYKANGVDPYISLDGVDDFLSTGINNAFGDFAVFGVFRLFNTTEAATRVLDKQFTDGFWIGTDALSAGNLGGGIVQSSAPYGDFYTYTLGTWIAFLIQRIGTTKTIRFNGVSHTATVPATALNTVPIVIGKDTSNTVFGQVDFKEFDFFNGGIAGADLTTLVGYALSEYGLTL